MSLDEQQEYDWRGGPLAPPLPFDEHPVAHRIAAEATTRRRN
jgi:hypothetical protein